MYSFTTNWNLSGKSELFCQNLFYIIQSKTVMYIKLFSKLCGLPFQLFFKSIIIINDKEDFFARCFRRPWQKNIKNPLSISIFIFKTVPSIRAIITSAVVFHNGKRIAQRVSVIVGTTEFFPCYKCYV